MSYIGLPQRHSGGTEYVGVVGEPGGKLPWLIPETARVVSGILEAPTPNASLVANRRGHGKGSRDGTVPALRNGNLGCVVHVCGLLARQVLFSWGGVEIVLCFQGCCVRVVVAVKSPYGLGFENVYRVDWPSKPGIVPLDAREGLEHVEQEVFRTWGGVDGGLGSRCQQEHGRWLEMRIVVRGAALRTCA